MEPVNPLLHNPGASTDEDDSSNDEEQRDLASAYPHPRYQEVYYSSDDEDEGESEAYTRYKAMDANDAHLLNNDVPAITDEEINEYFKNLNTWVVTMQHTFTMLNVRGLMYYHQLQNAPLIRNDNELDYTKFKCHVPSVSVRVGAELIDTVILFFCKLYLVVLVQDGLNIKYKDYVLALQSPDVLLPYTYQLATLELVTRVAVSVYEAYWLVNQAATPGKKICGLKVYAIKKSQLLRDGTVVAHGLKPVGKVASFFRSFIKYIGVIAFPITCGSMFFGCKRALYDYICGTIVVDVSVAHPQPMTVREIREAGL